MNIGYIRVSTKDQSTSRQLEGVELDIIYEEKISGVIKERPKLKECLFALRKGDTLHVHSMDRLARSLSHLQELVEQLIEKGVTIRFHTENLTFEPDKDNPMSMLLLQIFGAIAQFERKIIKSRQREGIDQARKNGTRTGKPFGQVPLDMKRSTEALDLHAKGMSISAIALQMKLSRPSVRKLLRPSKDSLI